MKISDLVDVVLTGAEDEASENKNGAYDDLCFEVDEAGRIAWDELKARFEIDGIKMQELVGKVSCVIAEVVMNKFVNDKEVDPFTRAIVVDVMRNENITDYTLRLVSQAFLYGIHFANTEMK